MFGHWKIDDFEGMTNKMLKETLSWCFKYTKILEANDKVYSREKLIHFASRNGFSSLVEKLLKEGIPVDLKDKSHYTPLHLASRSGHDTLGHKFSNPELKGFVSLHFKLFCFTP